MAAIMNKKGRVAKAEKERNSHNASPKHSHTHAHGMSHKHTSDDQDEASTIGNWRSRLLRKKEPVVGMISGAKPPTPEGAGAGGSEFPAPGNKSTSPTNKSQSGNMPTVQAPDGFLSGWGPIYREDDPPLLSGNMEKQMMDFGWKKYFVCMTQREVLMAPSRASNVADRIPLLEIVSVEESKLLHQHNDEPDTLSAKPKLSAQQMADQALQSTNPKSQAALSRARAQRQHSLQHAHIEASQCMFEIFTADGGLSNGRSYAFKCESNVERDNWVLGLRRQMVAEHERFLRENHRTNFYKLQRWMKQVYDSEYCSCTGAVMVLVNFIANIVQFEMLPVEGSHELHVFQIVEDVFTVLFTLELSMNMIANWFYPFWSDTWNILDFVVVLISIVAIPLESMPGVNVLRLLRVFRVVRLFKRLESLRTIVESLTAAILPVTNAFFVLLLIASLYAVLAVMLFGEKDAELFGSFSLSLFTMIQVTSGDGWVTDIVRPMHNNIQSHDAPIDLFFTTYYIITGIVMLNVVVAVLLDEFVNTVGAIKESQNEAGKTAREGVLDPLLEKLAHFNTSADLSSKIQAIYQMFDVDDNGRLTFEELSEGLRKLTLGHESEDQISLLPDEYEILATDIRGGSFLDENKQITSANFELLMRQQLAVYIQRQLAFGSLWEDEKRSFSCMQAALQGIKLLILASDADKTLTPAPAPVAVAPIPTYAPTTTSPGNRDRRGGIDDASQVPFTHSSSSVFGTAAVSRASIESIWHRFAPALTGAGESREGGGLNPTNLASTLATGGEEGGIAAVNARLDRLEAVTLHLCDKIGETLNRLDRVAPPGEHGAGAADMCGMANMDGAGGAAGAALVNLAEGPLATFRSANLASLGGLRNALGLGGGGGAMQGGSGTAGDGDQKASLLRDHLLPEGGDAAGTGSGGKSPRLKLPKTAEEAWKQKVDARLKRRAQREADKADARARDDGGGGGSKSRERSSARGRSTTPRGSKTVVEFDSASRDKTGGSGLDEGVKGLRAVNSMPSNDKTPTTPRSRSSSKGGERRRASLNISPAPTSPQAAEVDNSFSRMFKLTSPSK